jgi:tricorn protease-like protein
MVEIEYNTPIEVTEDQYQRIVGRYRMVVAHRQDAEGRYWIKLWAMEFKGHLEKELNKPN